MPAPHLSKQPWHALELPTPKETMPSQTRPPFSARALLSYEGCLRTTHKKPQLLPKPNPSTARCVAADGGRGTRHCRPRSGGGNSLGRAERPEMPETAAASQVRRECALLHSLSFAFVLFLVVPLHHGILLPVLFLRFLPVLSLFTSLHLTSPHSSSLLFSLLFCYSLFALPSSSFLSSSSSSSLVSSCWAGHGSGLGWPGLRGPAGAGPGGAGAAASRASEPSR